MEEKTGNRKAHKVLLGSRKTGNFSGVVDVLSFDVSEILLETEEGMLLIKGTDLHVNRLSLEKGEVDIQRSKITESRRNLFWGGCLNERRSQ